MSESTEITENPPKKKAGRPRRIDPPIKTNRPVGRPKLEYVSYEEARAWARSLHLKSHREWEKVRDKRHPKTGRLLRPAGIPRYPERAYQEVWTGMKDFFGFGSAAFFPYGKAKLEARKLGLKNARDWFKWWDKYKPITVPKRPAQYYKEWENWNEFLGTRNVFKTRNHRFVTYEQGLKLVHPLKFNNQNEYFEWHKANRPPNLPFHPDVSYRGRGWETWTKWLGRTVASRLESKNVNTAVWYIVHHSGLPANVIEISIDGVGKKVVLEKVKNQGLSLLKVYKYEVATKPQVETLIRQYSQPYWEDRRQRVCSNVPQMLFELDQMLEWA